MKQLVLFSAVSLSLFVSAFLTGCSLSNSGGLSASPQTVKMKGSVHGGQQPVSGATIQLYAVGTTGDGMGATPLLTSAVTTDANGNWSITNDYTCPDSNPLVYIVSTGGDPGMGSANSAIGLMAALGYCSTLSSSTFILLNEVTTVAAVAALAPFTTAPANIGSGTTDAAALVRAFQLAAEYADYSRGTAPGAGYSDAPGPYTPGIPVATINTLANILAACINTGGPASTQCSQLSSLLGGAPDTLSALVALMQNPAVYDTAGLFALASSTAPFQPQLSTAPPVSFGVAPQPPADSAPLFAFPSTVSPGDAMWLVAKQYPPCLESGGNNYVLLNRSVYTTGGTAQCGLIYGIVPSNVSYGTQSAEWIIWNSNFTSVLYDYSTYVTIAPKPTPTYAFKPNAAFWEGDATTHGSYDITVILVNPTGAKVTMGTSSFTGADASQFKVSSSYCENAVINPTGSCSVNLTFLPVDQGFHYATFVMPVTDGTGHVTYATVNLGGSGQYH